MNNLNVVSIENHRSRERIKEMGEVFTPEKYVQQMLSVFDDRLWSDENVIFFEPTAGHGNIVLPIVERRITSLTKKYLKADMSAPVLHAVANAIHTLWAIDICPLNVALTRKRVVTCVAQTLKTTEFDVRQVKMRDYLAHVLCTLLWQIRENEALSALSNEKSANIRASLTKLSQEWLKENKHSPMNFSLDWCEFYRLSKKQGIAPLQHKRAMRYIEAIAEDGKLSRFEEFAFAQDAIQLLAGKRKLLSERIGVA